MRKTLSLIVFISWALWLGGMIALFLFVMQLFTTNRDVATHAAPVLFRAFAVYQLIVGMIACAAGTLLTVVDRRKSMAAMSLLMIVALALGLVIRSWTNEMMTLDRSNPQQVARFQTLHHNTTRVYTTAACLLLAAGIGWVLILTSSASRGRAGESAVATGSPA
jgi:hypothetical protein